MIVIKFFFLWVPQNLKFEITLVDYLHVQADNPWFNYYLFAKKYQHGSSRKLSGF